MLRKSFKPAKCKTSLKLASSRIKLMKNKKGVQINQIKRDLAQLLDSGQDRTACIRVEHLIREEKMVAAYDLFELYCELIIARFPIIESQKTCPIDLKEAVTSVIFAAPRCSDITELLDIQKQFTAKYGKEFVSAAIELRPDCGVSRMLVEKLSAVAPDVQTKIKLLSLVAKEHDIKWDPTSLEEEEPKPPSDLLNGPANFEKAGMTNADPPKIQGSSIDVVHSHEEKHNAPFDFSQQNKKCTVDSQKFTSADPGGSAATNVDMKSSGTTSERMEIKQPFPRGNNDFSSGRQNWNMEFKDAASAAQAAAESAERASMAATAAAELSSHGKITMQHSTESHDTDIRDKTSEFPGHDHSRNSYTSSFDDRKPNIRNQQMDGIEHNMSPKATKRFDGDSAIKSHRPAPFRSNNYSLDAEKLVNNFHKTDGYFQESLREDQEGTSSPETSIPTGYKESLTELGSSQKECLGSEDFNCFAEEVAKKQPSISSSCSRSSTTSNELDVPGDQKFSKKGGVGNPFAVIGQGNPFREATKMNSNVDDPKDDESISDDDNGPRFDVGYEYDEVEAKSYFPSAGGESPIWSLENAHIWSPRRNKSDMVGQVSSQLHLFSESHSFIKHSVKSVATSEADNHIPLSFDHSDGSDSESELAKSGFSGIKEFSSHEHDLLSMNPEPSPVESSHNFSSSKSRIELVDLVERDASVNNPEDEEKRLQSQQSSVRHELKGNTGRPWPYDTLEDDHDSLNQSNDLESGKGLTFGTLTGGLRNKGGLKYPPYTNSAAPNASSMSDKSVKESSITDDWASPQSSFISRVSRMEDNQPSVPMSSSDSDLDYCSVKYPVHSWETSKRANTRLRFSPPGAFIDDDGTDSEEEVLKQASSRVHLGSGFSQRTKGSPFSYSKNHVKPEAKTVIRSSIEARNPSPYSYSDETPTEHWSYTDRFTKEDAKKIPESQAVEQPFSPPRKTSEFGSTEAQSSYGNETPSEPQVHPTNFKQEAFKTIPECRTPTHEPVVQSPASLRTTIESSKTETAKRSDLGSETSSGESLVKKPSHVHPKLPDYDSLAVRFQSLRTNRQ